LISSIIPGEEQMGNAPSDLRNVPTSAIRENPVALRGVDRESEKYVSLRDAIGRMGILNPINVREKWEPDGSTYFEICDGLHRYSTAKDLGLETIPVNVISFNDAEVLEAQVTANLCRIDTKPVEYTKQLQRMFTLNPTLTLADMAEKVCQSPAWVNQRLGLLKLDDSIQELVDDGKINLSNAYALAKLPKDEQANFVDSAITMVPAEFVSTVNKRAKELRESSRQGKEATEAKFEPIAHLRKLGELKSELVNPEASYAIVARTGAKTAAEGFRDGVRWALSLDPASAEVQEAKYNARIQKITDEKKKREVERAEKKAQEAAEIAVKIKEAAGALA
jgi:ParB/RepB/Spo0J family partition protein